MYGRVVLVPASTFTARLQKKGAICKKKAKNAKKMKCYARGMGPATGYPKGLTYQGFLKKWGAKHGGYPRIGSAAQKRAAAAYRRYKGR